jgi:PAS domain S-box-containing protein
MKKKVLIVDNNKLVVRLLGGYLQQRGYTVANAADGLAALDQLESFRPDVMLIDLIMPQINGEKLCRIIRRMPEYDSLFLVIISAIAAEDKVDFPAFGANACIAKGPARMMYEHLDQVLRHWENNDTEPLARKIFGEENLFERAITKELLATKKHLEVTLNNIDEGLLELNADGQVIFANPAAYRLLEAPEEEVLSAFFPDFFAAEFRPSLTALLAGQGEGRVEIGEEEPLIMHERYLLLKFVSFYDQGQRFIIVMMQNITRRKQAELALKNHQANLEEMVQERTASLEEVNVELEEALCKLKTLSGLLPICASCKKIRDDSGYWNQIELFIRDHSFAEFSHGICPECARKLYPDLDLFDDE